jgi:preprotein translocase subunit SecE
MAFRFKSLVQDVKSEITRVSWPTAKDTFITTALVVSIASLSGLVFFGIDQIISEFMKFLFGVEI